MFGIWAPPAVLEGRSIVLVAETAAGVSTDAVAAHFDGLGAVRGIDVRRRGVDVGTWYVRVGRGYRGTPRAP